MILKGKTTQAKQYASTTIRRH